MEDVITHCLDTAVSVIQAIQETRVIQVQVCTQHFRFVYDLTLNSITLLVNHIFKRGGDNKQEYFYMLS